MAQNRKPGCCCTSTICVVRCVTVPVYGATVNIRSAGTLVATCTTGSSGCCTVTVSGSFTVEVVSGGSIVSSTTRTLTAGGTIVVSLPNTNVVCCGGYAIPSGLTLTDFTGTAPFTYMGTLPQIAANTPCPFESLSGWYSCSTFEADNVAVCLCGTGGLSGNAVQIGRGVVALHYYGLCLDAGQAGCAGGGGVYSPGAFTVQMNAYVKTYDPAFPITVPGNCATQCGSPLYGISSDSTQNIWTWFSADCSYTNPSSLFSLGNGWGLSAAPTSASPFVWSGTLSPLPGNPAGLAPPGLGITISA